MNKAQAVQIKCTSSALNQRGGNHERRERHENDGREKNEYATQASVVQHVVGSLVSGLSFRVFYFVSFASFVVTHFIFLFLLMSECSKIRHQFLTRVAAP